MYCDNMCHKKERKKKRMWVSPYLEIRNKQSGIQILQDLKKDEVKLERNDNYLSIDSFKSFVRMSSKDFEFLVTLIGPKISWQDTNYINFISIPERLALTLHYLAGGDSYNSLMLLFRISIPSISKNVPEVCEAVLDSLKDWVKIRTELI